MSDSIPIEIQMEIVKRVPVKSLFRFRSVSKSWKSLIDSSQFISDYNACESRPQRLQIRYKHDPYPVLKFESRQRMLIRYEDDTKHYASVCIVDDDIFPQNKLPTTFPWIFEHILVGSSQGLLCLWGDYNRESIAFIWNPAIRKSIAIGVPGLYDLYNVVLGFGVCPNTNEPMLVMLNCYKERFWQVNIFTLSSGVWRRLRSNLPSRSIGFTRSQVAIDGFIYWQTFNRLIVSFDMTSEEFVEINLPRCLTYPSTKTLSIFRLRESLAVVDYCTEVEKPACAVWMMEHGFPKSFTKLFTIPIPYGCLLKVLGFRENGEAILEVNDIDDLYKSAVLKVYEPRLELIYKDLGIQGEHGSFFVASYKETLLLLDQTHDSQFIKMNFPSRNPSHHAF